MFKLKSFKIFDSHISVKTKDESEGDTELGKTFKANKSVLSVLTFGSNEVHAQNPPVKIPVQLYWSIEFHW